MTEPATSLTTRLHMHIAGQIVEQCDKLRWLHKDSGCETRHFKHLRTISRRFCVAGAPLVVWLVSLQGMQLQMPCACKHNHATVTQRIQPQRADLLLPS